MIIVHDIESGLARSVGSRGSGWMPGALRLAERLGLNGTDSVVVLTEEMRREVTKIGCRSPVAVLPIWADRAPARPVRRGRPPVLMYSGNFGRKQGLDQLLPLFERLAASGRKTLVELRGGGSERQRLETEVRSRAIPNVSFLPLVPTDGLMDALQGANVHLVPQARNVANFAMPSKLYSIMAAGRPFVCIAPPDSPLDHLSRNSGAGLCVPPDNSDALTAAVQALLADPDRQEAMGRLGQDFVQNNMARDVILSRFEKMILRLGAAPHPAFRPEDDATPDTPV